MKRIIAILTVLAIVACLAFATDPQLKITANVQGSSPIFIMKGGLSNGNYNKTAATEVSDDSTIECSTDISADNIKVYVQLLQDNVVKSTSGFTLEVTATPLKNTEDENCTAAVSVTSATAETYAGETLNRIGVSASSKEATATFTVSYKNGKPVGANTSIGKCEFTWTKNIDLPVGSYSATITLTCSGS